MSKIIEQARKFAAYHHGAIDQRRKYTNEKYIVHPAAVAKLVTSVGGSHAMIAAALLHDTVEDTNATIEDIFSTFGKTIGSYVAGLTDVARPEDGNRAARVIINMNHTAQQCANVKTIKIADCYDNVSSIMCHDKKFAVTYRQEKRELLPFLLQGNNTLFKMLSDLLKE